MSTNEEDIIQAIRIVEENQAGEDSGGSEIGATSAAVAVEQLSRDEHMVGRRASPSSASTTS